MEKCKGNLLRLNH